MLLKSEYYAAQLYRLFGAKLETWVSNVKRVNPCSIERVTDEMGQFGGGLTPEPENGGDVDVYRSLTDASLMLFHQDGTTVELVAKGNRQTVEMVNDQFQTGRDRGAQGNDLYGFQVFGLQDFLCQVGSELHRSGVTYIRIKWNERADKIVQLTRLKRQNLLRLRFGPRRGTYGYVKNRNYASRNGLEIDYILPEELAIFYLEPPLAKVPGLSRLKEVKSIVSRQRFLRNVTLASSHAWAYPEDRRCWVERARRFDIFNVISEERHNATRIRAILGGLVTLGSEPITQFFDIWGAIKWHWKVARFRESLLDQFNDKIVSRFLNRKGLTLDTRIEAAGARSSTEWETLKNDLESGRLDAEQAAEKFKSYTTDNRS